MIKISVFEKRHIISLISSFQQENISEIPWSFHDFYDFIKKQKTILRDKNSNIMNYSVENGNTLQ